MTNNDDWNEDRIDTIGQNGNTGDHYVSNVWKKHDGSNWCPEDANSMIEVETYSSNGNFTVKASSLDWQYVKFYRVVPTKK